LKPKDIKKNRLPENLSLPNLWAASFLLTLRKSGWSAERIIESDEINNKFGKWLRALTVVSGLLRK